MARWELVRMTAGGRALLRSAQVGAGGIYDYVELPMIDAEALTAVRSPRPQVVVHLAGGCVQEVQADGDVRVIIADADLDNAAPAYWVQTGAGTRGVYSAEPGAPDADFGLIVESAAA